MAGMKVVVTATDEKGNIDWDDLHQKAMEHKDNLAGLMITYRVLMVYLRQRLKTLLTSFTNVEVRFMDGANMNAQVGLTSPVAIGADVCHLNLHKTFAIPHGGWSWCRSNLCSRHLAPFFTWVIP